MQAAAAGGGPAGGPAGEEEEAGAVSHAAPGGAAPAAEGRSQTLAGRGFNRGPASAARWRRRPSHLGTREMRVSGGGAGAEGRRRRRRRPGPEPRCRSDWGRGGRAQAPARPEPPSRSEAEWRRGRGTRGRRTPGREPSELGPALSHPGRLGPGRAAAPDAGSERPGLDYALGGGGGEKKPDSSRPRRRPCSSGLSPGRDRARAAELGGRASGPGQPRRARLAFLGPLSFGNPAGRPDRCPFSPHPPPPGTASPPCVPFPPPRLVLSGKYWAPEQAEPRSRAVLSGSPSAALGVPACIVATVQVAINGLTVAPLPRSLRGGDRGGTQGCECDGRTGRSATPTPRSASRAGPRRAPGPAPGGSAR